MAILPVVGALFQAMTQAGSQAQQHALGQAQLNETRRNNQAMETLARAPRTDAFGNTTGYRMGEGFVTELSPLQQALIDQQQNEQFRQFSQDAPRNRAAIERRDARSRQGHDLFMETLQQRERPLERGEVVGRSVLDAMDIRNSMNTQGNRNLANIAVRGGGNLPLEDLQQVARHGSGAPSLAETLVAARESGEDRFVQRDNERNNSLFSTLSALGGIAGDTANAPVNFNNETGRLAGEQGQGVSQLLQVLQGNAGRINEAFRNLQNIAGNTVNVSPLFEALQGLVDNRQQQQQQQQEFTPRHSGFVAP